MPDDAANAVELPSAVKRHLGLDDNRSWVIVAEGNEFVWPGYDLRKIAGTDRFDFGFLPPRLFDEIRRAFVRFYRSKTARVARRS